ncbi:hypothetical protein AMTR_s00091p00036740 [Amborella trichopoda]|uniref:Uncharacterized protein n=1 Tax=Amborella trichopoda TaxID=13333 RepID=W1P0U7_AMBTC|nr:hypothetical protein AMTR_s00091p00036740 [Amborella trichopoda]
MGKWLGPTLGRFGPTLIELRKREKARPSQLNFLSRSTFKLWAGALSCIGLELGSGYFWCREPLTEKAQGMETIIFMRVEAAHG